MEGKKRIGNDWDDILAEDFASEYYMSLRKFLIKEYKTKRVYPDMHDIFNALKYTSYKDVKVVIIGQDPYHNEGEAHGLCFSVQEGIRIPPSLRNIYKEMATDIGCNIPASGCLTGWAKQGILMLNAVLTVRHNEPRSHWNMGWEVFTDKIITELSKREEPIVFILWGSDARKKKKMIDTTKHCIIESAHPSPLAAHRGFFGSRPFSKTNEFLKSQGQEPIHWELIG